MSSRDVTDDIVDFRNSLAAPALLWTSYV